MGEKVKSGKEILDGFFKKIEELNDVDKNIASMLVQLYNDDKLTETNVKNELQKLREQDESKN